MMKQMTQTEHLKLIRARCVELLEIAEKRTAGRWTTGKGSKTIRELDKTGPYGFIARTHLAGEFCPRQDLDKEANATFIASCAGAAEAGWRSTVAAIDAFFKLDGVTYGWDGDCGATCIADALADSITSAWPIELLNNK